MRKQITWNKTMTRQTITDAGLSEDQVGRDEFDAGKSVQVDCEPEALHGCGNGVSVLAFEQ